MGEHPSTIHSFHFWKFKRKLRALSSSPTNMSQQPVAPKHDKLTLRIIWTRTNGGFQTWTCIISRRVFWGGPQKSQAIEPRQNVSFSRSTGCSALKIMQMIRILAATSRKRRVKLAWRVKNLAAQGLVFGTRVSSWKWSVSNVRISWFISPTYGIQPTKI